MAERRQRLVIFVREPVAGRVKTRLGQDIGMVEAAWWFRHTARSLVRRLAGDPRWETWLAVTPDLEGLESRFWPFHLPRWSQGPGDLGARMARVFRSFPPGPVIIVGADLPDLQPGHVAEAFAQLGRADAVLGPSPDGGFWLVGLARGRRPAPAGLFRDVRWSTRHALADTLATLRGHRVSFAAPLADVDAGRDLQPQRRARTG